ncbi:MAG: hypothetical protein Q4B70_19510 [Lachnospiraceae bacterium]|nr:hypothetical protein [Lachnospiraceae bacterium]
MDNNKKEVDFEKYCKMCKDRNTVEINDPCNDCLDYPYNVNSQKPVNYKEDK